MQLLRRLGSSAGVGAGASLFPLHAALRHSSSSSNDKGSHHNGATPTSDGRGSAGGEGSAVPPTTQTSTTFKGWKRFDLPRDSNSATTAVPPLSSSVMAAEAPPPPLPQAAAASSPLSVLSQKGEDEVTRRQAASARLADMFVESGRHTQWMQKQHQQQQSGHSQHYDEARASVRLVEVQDSDLPAPVRSGAARPPDSRVRNYAYDEDEESIAPSGAEQYSSSLTPAAAPVEVLEHELLDDNYLYYPPAPLSMGEGVASTEHARFGKQQQQPVTASKPQERYVPGQQIIPPGFTRYRVDVQYQGGDFDGWFKSVQRSRPSAHATGSRSLSEGSSRHYARTVLEEALAVALDVATVSVVAAVIPETGVSVRRLCCHVDLPSEVELQSRTILQRATLWLHQRQQPLAILSCAPCRNQDFHARHTGVRRVYCYRILNRIAPPLFDAGLQWHVDRYLDVPRMQRMAAVMTGTHDYGYFADPKMANALRRAAANAGGGGGGGSGPVVSAAYSAEHEPLTSYGLPTGQASAAPKVAISRGLTQLERAAALPTFNELGQRVVTYQAKPREYFKAHTNLPTIRTIDKIDVVRQEDEVLIWFVGRSFLRHQIRNMVSVLKAGGHGLWDDQELQHAFQSGFEVSRKKFVRERLPPAPVHGLTLWDVDYPAQHTSDFVPYVDAGPYEPYDVSTQH